MRHHHLILILLLIGNLPLFAQQTKKTDVLVIGGGVGGTVAAIQSARMGVKTLLIEPTHMLGGMLTAAGVSCTDGNDQFASGIWEEFRQALYKHYKRNRLNTGWVSNTNFEPHVADSIFKAWAAAEKNLEVIYGYNFNHLEKKGDEINLVTFYNIADYTRIQVVKPGLVIDATELGDLFAAAGEKYDLGMDDPAASGEKEAREKNNIIQDITWAAILKDYGKDADKTISKPTGYDPQQFYCCCTDAPCQEKPWNGDKIKMLNYGKLPRSPGATMDKYMLNWPAHGNDLYVDVVENDYFSRDKEYEKAKQHTLGFIYFMQTELGMKNIGLANDELNNGLAWIPYNREGRRVRGLVRMNINHIKQPYDYTLYRTGISVGDYPVDHHHAKYPGPVPKIEFPSIPAFNIPLGTLIASKTSNLIICEKGISVSNIVNGTTRLQPVVMLTGQAAGVLAALSIISKKEAGKIPVREVQEKLLDLGCYLMPFSDVKINDPAWESIQRVGLTGILKGQGKPEGWSNKMFFFPDSLVGDSEISFGISRYYSGLSVSTRELHQPATISSTFDFLKKLKPFLKQPAFSKIKNIRDLKNLWEDWGLKNFDPARIITRREASVMLDKCLLLFTLKNYEMDINGQMNFKQSKF